MGPYSRRGLFEGVVERSVCMPMSTWERKGETGIDGW